MSMKLDLRKLEEFDQMAIDGADGASDRLSGLTGVDTSVDCSRLHVVAATAVIDEFERDDVLAISISLEGYLEGEVVTVLDSASARELAEAFMPMLPSDDGYTSKHESAVEEICNVMVSGYVDGWANVQGESIVMSPPSVVSSAFDAEEGVRSELLEETEHVLSQRSSIVTPDDEIEFQMFLFLDEATSRTQFGADPDASAIDYELLEVLTALDGMEPRSIGDHLLETTEFDADVAIDTLDIVPAERLSETVSDEESLGAVVELVDPPIGSAITFFDDRDGSTDEVGAAVTTSLVDEIADRLEVAVRAGEPTIVDDMRSSIVNDVVANLGPGERFVLSLEGLLESTAGDLSCDVYLLLSPKEIADYWAQR
ncbi:chemotaxis protein CheC [Haloterrigena gelatinilytica]|nr:chemotaxis protein CheC [Haloterrigena gelatinilytica]